MKPKKQKTYLLPIAVQFPTDHPNAGQLTNFKNKIDEQTKKHTIRQNYDYWAARFEKIKNGDAILVLKEWTGRPYFSKQKTLKTLNNKETCLQKIYIDFDLNKFEINKMPDALGFNLDLLAQFDGLTLEEFKDWFKYKQHDKTKPLALICFRSTPIYEKL